MSDFHNPGVKRLCESGDFLAEEENSALPDVALIVVE